MRLDRELACRGIVELVTAYLDDALEPAVRERFDEHLAFCEGCNRNLEQMQLTIEATGHLGVERLPAELEERLLEAFRGGADRDRLPCDATARIATRQSRPDIRLVRTMIEACAAAYVAGSPCSTRNDDDERRRG